MTSDDGHASDPAAPIPPVGEFLNVTTPNGDGGGLVAPGLDVTATPNGDGDELAAAGHDAGAMLNDDDGPAVPGRDAAAMLNDDGTGAAVPENAVPENAVPEAVEAPVVGDGPSPPRPGQLQLTPVRRGKPPRHLADLDVEARRAAVAELGQKAFRADQLSRHYFARFTSSPDDMTDLPAGIRDELSSAMLPQLATPVRHLEADGGTTRKTLWRLFDGALVESVLMRYRGTASRRAQSGAGDDGDGEHVHRTGSRDRITVCVSSQAGCGMNCPFCATGQQGLTRNMSTAEIVEQVVAAARAAAGGEIAGGPGRVTNVVFMGMGEPMANYKAVINAVRRLTDPAPAGLGLGQRGVTVSTVGLVPAIDKLAAEELSVTLALSLHAPDDGLRDELVPINTRWKVAEALDAAKRYFDRTGRRVSIEYALIRDINDHAWRAELLGRLLTERGRGWVHVNPIPLNPTPGSKWTASDPAVEREFVAALEDFGIPVTVRDTRGRDIDGACGQLATSSA